MIYAMMLILSGLQAAAAATVQATATAIANPTDNVVATGGFALVCSVILQSLKNSNQFPWLSRETARINFWIGLLVAGLSTAGVHLRYDYHTGGVIELPSVTGLFQWVIQWAAQQGAYKGLIVPAETLGDIRSRMDDFIKAVKALQTEPPK